jgi:rhamnogalacturonyl hydrolase YesR
MGTHLGLVGRSVPLVLGLVALADAPCLAQSTVPSPDAGAAKVAVSYPFDYRAPTVGRITEVLERVRGRLDAAVTPRFVDRRTHRPVTDLSRGVAGVEVDPGAEGKFVPTGYPMGVVNTGMLAAAEATGDKRFSDFPVRWFELYAKSLPVLAKSSADPLSPPTTAPTTEPAMAGGPSDRTRGDEGDGGKQVQNPLRAMLSPNSLDDCGAMTTAMIKAKLAGLGPDLGPTIRRAIDFVHERQFRLPDGTLARHRPVRDTIWADDMYMGVSLLAAAGQMTGDKVYYDDAARQVLQIGHHLWVPERQLMTHAWNTANPDFQPRYFWGRANGWCMMAMAELLTVLPEDHPDRPAVLTQFCSMAQAVASLQATDGLWHQMLDRPDTYTESSCSGMFVFALARGVNRGWLNAAAYGPTAESAWGALAGRVDKTGHIAGTCVGTSYGDDYVFYAHRPETDDVHGYGPLLLAGAEMIHLVKDGRPATGDAHGINSPLYYSRRGR